VNAQYLEDLYRGETALHIAIVRGNLDMVEFLLKNAASPNLLCNGVFFALEGQIYLGGYPLSFAAAIEDFGQNKKIIDLLICNPYAQSYSSDSPKMTDFACLENQDQYGT